MEGRDLRIKATKGNLREVLFTESYITSVLQVTGTPPLGDRGFYILNTVSADPPHTQICLLYPVVMLAKYCTL
jgi:hypothetical protein